MAIIKQCVVCHGDFVARARAKTCSLKCRKDKAHKRVTEYRAAHPEKCRQTDREAKRRAYRLDPDKSLDRHAKAFAALRLVRKMQGIEPAIKRTHDKETREKQRLVMREWVKRNPEKVRNNAHTSYLKRASALRLVKRLQNMETEGVLL